MISKILLRFWLYLVTLGNFLFVHSQDVLSPPGGAIMPVRSGLAYNGPGGNFFSNAKYIYRIIDLGNGTHYLQKIVESNKEIKSIYVEKRIIDGLYSIFTFVVQYQDGDFGRIRFVVYAGNGDEDVYFTPLPAPPGPNQPTKIAGDDLYCFVGEDLYVLRDQINGPWLIDIDGLPDDGDRTLQDMNIDSFQNVWLICNNQLYMQPLVSNTWTLKNNLKGNHRLFIDRFQKIWLGRSGQLAYTINQGTNILAGPGGIGSGEGILGLSTDYNGDVYIMTYTSGYPFGDGGGNKIYYSAGGTADFVRIDQNLAPLFAKIGTNQIYNGIYADSGVFVAHASGLHFSKDAGVTWNHIPGPPSISAYSVIPTNDNQLMISVPAGAYKGNNGNWVKKHPADGFQNNLNFFRAGNGDIYVRGETFSYLNAGATRQAWMIYKSTDNGNNFVADTSGLQAANVSMSSFYVDETGIQHASGSIFLPGIGNRSHIWKKPPSQPWVLDMDGFSNTNNPSILGFTGDGFGNIYCHLRNQSFIPYTLTRNVGSTTWVGVAQLDNKLISDQAGRADGVSVFATVSNGLSGGELVRKTGNSYTNIPLPNGIVTANITSASVAFDSSGALWTYFTQYPFTPSPTPPDAIETGSGLFYTKDFTSWKKPSNDVDTALFRSITAIGDSVFAIPKTFAGVYVFRKLAAGSIYTFIGNGNWTDASNWQNNVKPPAVLPAGSEIFIQPEGNGECILNTSQTVAPGGKFTVSDSKKLRVTGTLNIIQN